jgi:hypothetical protein
MATIIIVTLETAKKLQKIQQILAKKKLILKEIASFLAITKS